jgi:hypothetical protein
VGAGEDLHGSESEASRSAREADSRTTAPAMQRAPQDAALACAQPADAIIKHCLVLCQPSFLPPLVILSAVNAANKYSWGASEAL